ncbi:MAG: D-glycero-alpha-D-manno-heptose-1,7-bisphosphate 7-phosphatase [Candidatus Eisenbacteria bacterium]
MNALPASRPAVFLDRDGTILDLVPYLHDAGRVRLVPGAARALLRLGEAGYARIVVSNQSGIARGFFDEAAVERVHARMLELLRAGGADLEGIEICPHHPDFTGDCECRKPAPGMLRRAAERLAIDLPSSWVVGDRLEDLAAGSPLGCRGILVRTGYGREEEAKIPSRERDNVLFVADDLGQAVEWLLALPARQRGESR